MNVNKTVLTILVVTLLFLYHTPGMAQGMAVNTSGASANSSAILDASSTTQGMLIPRMSETQRIAISSPATGLLVYQLDNTTGFYFYNGSGWTSLNAMSNVTTQGNTFNGNSQLVQTTPGGALPVISGANVTSLNAGNLSAGTVPTARQGSGTASSSTVLHGNQAWGAVALASDVSGNLPAANLNGGTDASASTFWCGNGTWATPAAGGGSGAIQFYGTITAAAAFTAGSTNKLLWNSASVNVGTQMALSGGSTGSFTATAAGYYLITAGVQVDASTATFLSIRVNNTVKGYSASAVNSSVFPGIGQSGISHLLKLNANDVVTIHASCAAASNLALADPTYLAIYKL